MTRRRRSFRASSDALRNVASLLPSSTKRISYSIPSGSSAPTIASCRGPTLSSSLYRGTMTDRSGLIRVSVEGSTKGCFRRSGQCVEPQGRHGLVPGSVGVHPVGQLARVRLEPCIKIGGNDRNAVRDPQFIDRRLYSWMLASLKLAGNEGS